MPKTTKAKIWFLRTLGANFFFPSIVAILANAISSSRVLQVQKIDSV
jgi:hypothetical protein